MIFKSIFYIQNLFLIILYINCSEFTNAQQINPAINCSSHKENNINVGKPLYLTALIRTGQIEKAQNLARVEHEQMDKIAPSYSGFLTVNETFQSNLFFWYFPAKNNPKTAPVILWLEGGPGGSFGYTLFYTNGPFALESYNELAVRNYSWHINHHLIYIDNPVGVGFSYTENEEGYARNEIDVGDNLYEATIQFFTLFPRLKNNDFYISGESYAGKYAPALGYAIHTKNDLDEPKINLKGLFIDSGYIDPIHQINYGEYLYQIGVIDENGRDEFSKYESLIVECINQQNFECATNNIESMFFQNVSSLYYNYTGLLNYHHYLLSNYENFSTAQDELFLRSTKLRRALHVGNYSYYRWNEKVNKYLWLDISRTVADWVVKLLSHYRIMFYDGQLDVICAYPLLENAIKNWNFSGYESYKYSKRHIWRVDSDIAGYIKQGGNLTSVMVRNSGHGTSFDQPKWTLDLIDRFIANDLLSDS